MVGEDRSQQASLAQEAQEGRPYRGREEHRPPREDERDGPLLLAEQVARDAGLLDQAAGDRAVVAAADGERRHLRRPPDGDDVGVPAGADRRHRQVQEADAQPELGEAAAGVAGAREPAARRGAGVPGGLGVVAGEAQGPRELVREGRQRVVGPARTGHQELDLGPDVARGAGAALALDADEPQALSDRPAGVAPAVTSRAQADRPPPADLRRERGAGVGIVAAGAGGEQPVAPPAPRVVRVAGARPERVEEVAAIGGEVGEAAGRPLAPAADHAALEGEVVVDDAVEDGLRGTVDRGLGRVDPVHDGGEPPRVAVAHGQGGAALAEQDEEGVRDQQPAAVRHRVETVDRVAGRAEPGRPVRRDHARAEQVGAVEEGELRERAVPAALDQTVPEQLDVGAAVGSRAVRQVDQPRQSREVAADHRRERPREGPPGACADGGAGRIVRLTGHGSRLVSLPAPRSRPSHSHEHGWFRGRTFSWPRIMN